MLLERAFSPFKCTARTREHLRFLDSLFNPFHRFHPRTRLHSRLLPQLHDKPAVLS